MHATHFQQYLGGIQDMTMYNIKQLYLCMLRDVPNDEWPRLYDICHTHRTPRILENTRTDLQRGTSFDTGSRKVNVGSVGAGAGAGAGASLMRQHSVDATSRGHGTEDTGPKGTLGMYVTTKDAYTLTDGPTLFLAHDVMQVGRFCRQHAMIPNQVMDDLRDKLQHNACVMEQIKMLENEKQLEEEKINRAQSGSGSGSGNESSKDLRKLTREPPTSMSSSTHLSSGATQSRSAAFQLQRMHERIANTRAMLKPISFNSRFVPNTLHHLELWAPYPISSHSRAFTSSVSDDMITEIVHMDGVDNELKLLLMMGIGVFAPNLTTHYMEIMKQLADNQQLYLIVASSDYIYGTNYQFCHGFLGKSMGLTQEKIIQSLGRIGRGHLQQDYTIRLRDDTLCDTLFFPQAECVEAIHMNRIFCT
jgi:hypothetical protein